MEDKPATGGHCERPIPRSSIDLHTIHCSRYLEKCKVCGDMVPKKQVEEHFLNTHAPVSCSRCGEIVDRDFISVHTGEKCPQRMVVCKFCEIPLPVDLPDHQDVCGNRTDWFYKCQKYIRLRELDHESQCNPVIKSGWSDTVNQIDVPNSNYPNEEEDYYLSDDSSSNGESDQIDDPLCNGADDPTAEPEETKTERPGGIRKGVVLTVAAVGMAVLLGCSLLSRRRRS